MKNKKRDLMTFLKWIMIPDFNKNLNVNGYLKKTNEIKKIILKQRKEARIK